MSESLMMPNVLLMGGTGSGKTYCLRTIIDAGLELFVLQTEPSEVLDDLPIDKFHKCYVPATAPDWATLKDNANKINQLSYKAIANLEEFNRQKYRQFITVLERCNNFIDDRTGKAYGDVMTWGPDRAFVIDSLSGLNMMAMQLVVGAKPAKGQEQWGMAMENLENLVTLLTANTRCLFVLTAHVEREGFEETGGSMITVSTLGRKLAPKLPRFFSDVIYCQRKGLMFTWSTAADGVDTKGRNLPIANDLKPSFVPLIETWRQRHVIAKAA